MTGLGIILVDDSDDDPVPETPKKKKAKKSNDAKVHRAFHIVLNNYTEDEIAAIKKLATSYQVVGKEVGENGTPHLQGYLYFKNARTFSSIHKTVPRLALLVAEGDAMDNYKYCTKDGDFWELGVRPRTSQEKGEAERERWSGIIKKAKEGDLDGIAAEEPKAFVQFYSTLKNIKKDFMVKPADLPNVCGIWVDGESGTGKTTWARTKYPDAYIKSRDKWWCGYQGEDVVICDDLDPFNKSLASLIKDWGDKYSFKAESKNGYTWIRPKIVIITSQYKWGDIWDDQETKDAIARRYERHHWRRDGAPVIFPRIELRRFNDTTPRTAQELHAEAWIPRNPQVVGRYLNGLSSAADNQLLREHGVLPSTPTPNQTPILLD